MHVFALHTATCLGDHSRTCRLPRRCAMRVVRYPWGHGVSRVTIQSMSRKTSDAVAGADPRVGPIYVFTSASVRCSTCGSSVRTLR